MAETNLQVYLDHHLKREHLNREDLLSRRTTPPKDWPRYLLIKDLYGGDSKTHLLKKPDFHRITWNWTPEQCVDLLERVLNAQYVPDIILWLGPDGSLYVIDGIHRISILIAWVEDDWGDKLPAGAYQDETHESASKAAARLVRELLREREIGFFNDYQTAHARYEEFEKQQGRKPGSDEMDAVGLRHAESVRQWEVAPIGLPILWVKGDYAQAEASVLSYLEEFEKLRVLHNDVFDTPEFQAAHEKLMEKLGREPESGAP